MSWTCACCPLDNIELLSTYPPGAAPPADLLHASVELEFDDWDGFIDASVELEFDDWDGFIDASVELEFDDWDGFIDASVELEFDDWDGFYRCLR
jgi:hypothetical protein